MIKKLPRLDKSVFSCCSLQEEGDERAYWLAKTPLERLDALELNRRMVYGHDRATSRLQRFLEISQLPRG